MNQEEDSKSVFVQDDSLRDFVCLKPKLIHDEYNISYYPVVVLPFDKICLEIGVAHGMIFKGKRSETIHTFTVDVYPGYKNIEKFSGGVQWYMTERKNFISNISFSVKNKNGRIISFNGVKHSD